MVAVPLLRGSGCSSSGSGLRRNNGSACGLRRLDCQLLSSWFKLSHGRAVQRGLFIHSSTLSHHLAINDGRLPVSICLCVRAISIFARQISTIQSSLDGLMEAYVVPLTSHFYSSFSQHNIKTDASGPWSQPIKPKFPDKFLRNLKGPTLDAIFFCFGIVVVVHF